MRILAAIAACIVALAVAGPASATTHPTANAVVACVDGRAVATFTYSGFSPANHLTATETLSGVATAAASWQFDGPGSKHTLSAPISGLGTVTATSTVRAGAGRIKATAIATVTCRDPQPPPPDGAHRDPRAWAQGPCGDPMYRFVLDNTRSNRAVTFRITYLNFDTGWTSWTRSVGADVKVRTRYHHVRGLSPILIQWVRPGPDKRLYSRLSAPGGNYGPCPGAGPAEPAS